MRIMVTMPRKAADDYGLVRDLLAQGMDCMRINCAHEGPDGWARMIDNLRRATNETRKGCRVLMDLPGPRPPAKARKAKATRQRDSDLPEGRIPNFFIGEPP